MKLSKEDAKELVAKKPPASNRMEKNRALHKQMAQNGRFKIVNCTRTLEETASNSAVTVLDVEKEKSVSPTTTANTLAKETTSSTAAPDEDDRFVYDVYVQESFNQNTASDNLLDLDDVRLVSFEDLFFMMTLTLV